MNNYKSLLGKRIKFFRKKKKLTQEKLAELVNRSKNHISKIEQGFANPPLELVIDIARNLDITLKDLFDFEFTESFDRTDAKKELISNIELSSDKHLRLLLKMHKSLELEKI